MEEYPKEKTADLSKIQRAIKEGAHTIDNDLEGGFTISSGKETIHIPYAECRTHRELLDWRRKLSELPWVDDDQICAFEKAAANNLPSV